MYLLSIIFYSYAAATLLVALRLGWHMAFKLDRYNWCYEKGDIWQKFGLSVLLWPLLLMMKLRTRRTAKKPDEAPARPVPTLDPTKLFSNPYGAAARARFRDNPPPCSTVIRYRQANGYTHGEFLFQAEAVERVLINRLHEAPHREIYDYGDILNWVRHRDARLPDPTDVPALWDFRSGANELVRAGEGRVRCIKCEETFPTGALIPRDDHGRPGWNVDLLTCPHGHALLEVEKYHITI